MERPWASELLKHEVGAAERSLIESVSKAAVMGRISSASRHNAKVASRNLVAPTPSQLEATRRAAHGLVALGVAEKHYLGGRLWVRVRPPEAIPWTAPLL